MCRFWSSKCPLASIVVIKHRLVKPVVKLYSFLLQEYFKFLNVCHNLVLGAADHGVISQDIIMAHDIHDFILIKLGRQEATNTPNVLTRHMQARRISWKFRNLSSSWGSKSPVELRDSQILTPKWKTSYFASYLYNSEKGNA